MDNLVNIIEAILFVAGEGIQTFDIADKLFIDEKEVKKAVEELKNRYERMHSGIKLVSYNGKVQLATNQEYITEITTVLNPIKEKQLTKAVLEVMAIIAYKQPVTRLDVENVRGVNCDYAVSTLLDNNLIEVVGRKDAVGKPLLFGTTDLFLKRFNLHSVDELPDYDTLLERIKIIETPKDNNSLFEYGEHIEEKENKTEETDEEIQEKLDKAKEEEQEQIRIYQELSEQLKGVNTKFEIDTTDSSKDVI